MIVQHDPTGAVADWTAMQIWGEVRSFGENVTFGVFQGDVLCAGLVWNEWNPDAGTIELSCAHVGSTLASKRVFPKAFEYPFSFARMIVARYDETNKPCRRLYSALGAKQYRIPDLRGEGKAEIIATLTKDQWAKSRLYHE